MPIKNCVFFIFAMTLMLVPAYGQENESPITSVDNTAAAIEPVEQMKVEEPTAAVPERVDEVIPEVATPTMVLPQIKSADLTLDQKNKIKQERKSRREEWIKAHPEQLKVMQENRLKRQQWMRDHPQEAKKMREEMRAKLMERRSKMKADALK